MKQFTSHIDFSLTKKRFKMMVKHYSPFRGYSKKIMLIPLIIAITLAFCTTQEDDTQTVFTINNEDVYSDVELYSDKKKVEELNMEDIRFGIQFDRSTELPFTGVQETRYLKNDKLYSKAVYKEGALISSTLFDADENTKYRFEMGYNIGDEKISFTRQFNKEDILISESKGSGTDLSLGTIKEWYLNGQIKFEMTYKSGGIYHGLMTLYDENGEIVEQELYEDGELVEKIK